MNRIILLSVDDAWIKRSGETAGASGSAGAVTLRMTFDSAWYGTSKTVYFTDALGENSVKVLLGLDALVTDNTYDVPVPGEAMTQPGQATVTVVGESEGRVITTQAARFRVLDAAIPPSAGNSQPITPDEAAQLQAQIDALEEIFVTNRQQAQDAAQQAESAKDAVQEAIDNIPPGAVLVINDLTTGGTAAALSAEQGKKLDETKADRQLSNLDTPQAALVNLGAGVRPNLVENWMLKNAINQKGQLSYSGDFAFSIDRWRLGSKTSMTVSESGEVTAIGDGSGESYIFQYLESLEKGTYTYSVLFTDNTGVVTLTTKQTDEGTVAPVNSIDPAGLLSLTFEAQGLGPGVGYIRIGMTGSVKPVAAKLERGSNQTLAHLKSDGMWELLPQPNNKPGDLLRECQRYLMVFGENTGYTPLGIGQARSDSAIVATIPIPCKMRTKPAATLSENIVARNGDSYFNLTTPTVEGLSDSAVMVSFVGSGLTVGAVYEVFLDIGKFFTLSSEL